MFNMFNLNNLRTTAGLYCFAQSAYFLTTSLTNYPNPNMARKISDFGMAAAMFLFGLGHVFPQASRYTKPLSIGCIIGSMAVRTSYHADLNYGYLNSPEASLR